MIGKTFAEQIRNMIVERQENIDKLLPTILEIPTLKSAHITLERIYVG